MAWAPDEAAVGQVLEMLQASQTPDTAVQAQVQAQLAQYQAVPEFNQTLSFIFVKLRDQPIFTRTAAGLLLKNNILQSLESMPPAVVEALKAEMLEGIADPERRVRRTIGTCISTVATKMGDPHDQYGEWLASWPSLMPTLAGLLDTGELAAVDGALDVLSKICEDVPDRMVADSQQPLNVILPKLFAFFSSEEGTFREAALHIMNQFILLDPPALQANFDTFLQGIFHLTSDTHSGTRKRVCQAINQLVEVHFEALLPHIDGVIQFMLHTITTDQDGAVILDALEFWQYIAEAGTSPEARTAALDAIRPYLPQLVEALLDGMTYEEDDPALEFAEDIDEHVPDREQDIAPIHRRGGGAEEEEDEDDDDDGDTAWNRRKGSAAALDLMATTFRNELLPILLPLMQQLLQMDDWLRRESGILAIGAIAYGCFQEMCENMSELLPFMMTTLDDEKPLIRSISCWAISRYSRWVVDCSSRHGQPEVLAGVMQKLLERCLDGNKRVQEAAISALATLEEEARQELIPYLEPIIQTMVACFEKYQTKNLLILFDAVATMAEGAGPALAQPEVIAVLMPPILAKWESLADDNKTMIPLQETLAALAGAMNAQFLPFFEPIFGRAIGTVTTRVQAITSGAADVPDFEFATVALDLISALSDAIPVENLAPVVAASGFIPLLITAIQVETKTDVKRPLFALIGDGAKRFWEQMAEHVAPLLPMLIEHLNPWYVSICNNAAWSIGEIAMQAGPAMEPYVIPVCEKLLSMLEEGHQNPRRFHRSLMENSAICVGRLGCGCPAVVAAQVEQAIPAWCVALRNVRDYEEKEHAFTGLVQVLQANPEAGVIVHDGAGPALGFICDAFCSWNSDNIRAKPELLQQLTGTMAAFKLHMGGGWANFWLSLHESVQRKLAEVYGIDNS